MYRGVLIGIALALTATMARAGSIGPDWIMLRPPGTAFHIYAPLSWTPVPTDGATKFEIENVSKGYRLYVACAVIVTPTPQTATYTQKQLDAYLISNGVPDGIISNTAATLHDFSLRARKVISVNDRPAAYISYSGKLVAKSAFMYSVAAEIGELRPSETYALNCTASDATNNSTAQQAEASWRLWADDIEGILSSFDFDK